MPNDDIYDGSSKTKAKGAHREKSSLRGIFAADLPLHAACSTLWQEEDEEEVAAAATEPC